MPPRWPSHTAVCLPEVASRITSRDCVAVIAVAGQSLAVRAHGDGNGLQSAQALPRGAGPDRPRPAGQRSSSRPMPRPEVRDESAWRSSHARVRPDRQELVFASLQVCALQAGARHGPGPEPVRGAKQKADSPGGQLESPRSCRRAGCADAAIPSRASPLGLRRAGAQASATSCADSAAAAAAIRARYAWNSASRCSLIACWALCSAWPRWWASRTAKRIVPTSPRTRATPVATTPPTRPLCRRANLCKWYKADGGRARIGSWSSQRLRSAARSAADLVAPRGVLLQSPWPRSSRRRRGVPG